MSDLSFEGNGFTGRVTVGGYALQSFNHILNKSQTGFAWGVRCPGASQLAFAMLYHLGHDTGICLSMYQRFMEEVILTQAAPGQHFKIRALDINAWVDANKDDLASVSFDDIKKQCVR